MFNILGVFCLYHNFHAIKFSLVSMCTTPKSVGYGIIELSGLWQDGGDSRIPTPYKKQPFVIETYRQWVGPTHSPQLSEPCAPSHVQMPRLGSQKALLLDHLLQTDLHASLNLSPLLSVSSPLPLLLLCFSLSLSPQDLLFMQLIGQIPEEHH